MDRFEDKGCDFILDHATGLEWQKDTKTLTWQQAVEHISTCPSWRLPKIEELIALLDYSLVNPASGMPNTPPHPVWSSSVVVIADDDVYVRAVDFKVGCVLLVRRTDVCHMRAVRESTMFCKLPKDVEKEKAVDEKIKNGNIWKPSFHVERVRDESGKVVKWKILVSLPERMIRERGLGALCIESFYHCPSKEERGVIHRAFEIGCLVGGYFDQPSDPLRLEHLWCGKDGWSEFG